MRLDEAGQAGGGPQAGDGHELLLPLTGVPSRMLAVWSLLLLWGLATPCHGLLETVGTLARIDKDELGKGEPEAGSL